LKTNNTYDVRAYIIYDSITLYSMHISHTTGWGKYFDNIYENASNLELGNTKQKRAIIIVPSYKNTITLSQLGGEYYKTSDGYLGMSENHIFNENADIPIYLEDGITIKCYVRWVIIYTSTSSAYIGIDDRYNKNCTYIFIGNGTTATLNMGTVYTGDPVSLIQSIRCHPSSILNMGQYGFSQCKQLKTAILPNTLTTLVQYLFYQSGIISFIIPSSVTTLGRSCLSITNLTSIIIPSSVTTLGASFGYQSLLRTLVIPSSVSVIPDNGFDSMRYLYRLVLPININPLGVSAFANCVSLKSILLPTNITSLPVGCFSSCISLEYVTIPVSVTDIGNSVICICYSR